MQVQDLSEYFVVLVLFCVIGNASTCDVQTVHEQYSMCLQNLTNELKGEVNEYFILREYDDDRMNLFCGATSNFVDCVTNLTEGCPTNSNVTDIRNLLQNVHKLRTYMCNIARTDVLERSSCWLVPNVQSEIDQCKADHRLTDFNDTGQLCTTIDDLLYCMEYTISKFCGEKSAVIYTTRSTLTLLLFNTGNTSVIKSSVTDLQNVVNDWTRTVLINLIGNLLFFMEFNLAKSRTTIIMEQLVIQVECTCPMP